MKNTISKGWLENPGMAFGMQVIPKAVQTIGRILFAGIIIWYIGRLIKANCKRGYLICISLILAGAIGNIIDSIFMESYSVKVPYLKWQLLYR